ncbi:MAG TPA: glycosyltransferase family 9 protein [Stellaceae bacterium]|nr:glycosyltransferase family 9 protein [Stellaceae bacterium]
MKILFITATRIGDAVLSTGLLSHLIATHPGARFTIAAGPAAAPLFAAVPGLDQLIVVEKRRYALHWLALYRHAALTRWDLVVDLRGSALSYLVLAKSRRVAAKGDYAEHRVAQLGRLLSLAPPPAPRLWFAAAHRDRAAALIPPGGPVLAIGPCANWRGKEWPAERFAALAEALTARDGPLPQARIAIAAASHERARAEPVLASIPAARRIDLIGQDLLTVAASLGRCALFVGNDTGLMHVAAATGIPTLGLFGPSHASHYGPWGKLGAVVSTAIPAMELFRIGFDHRTTDSLMGSLSVAAAEREARDLLARVAGAVA